jgi:LemA protein
MAKTKISPLWILLGIALLLVLWVWSGYSGLVSGSERVDAAWAQVETQYQRRFDLIPNLVSTVKGAAQFEQETFIAVTEARTQWMGAGSRGERIAAAEGLDSALARLLVTFENYPQLQATQAYRDLMVQLEGTENRVAVARRDYNEEVRSFNVRVKRFPGNLLARFFGFQPQAFFEAAEGSEAAPTVDFGS